jgi:glycosyltransferase involved in cell wall biosynthesis
MITIGIYVRGGGPPAAETVESLARCSPGARAIAIPSGLGPAAAFNWLAPSDGARLIVLLENGCVVTPGWLDRICAAFDAHPQFGLAGPSTNLAWNRQRLASAPPSRAALGEIEAFATTLGDAVSNLAPLHSLADFCYVVKREVIDALGEADEGFRDGGCWEMEYNARALRAGFAGAWVHGAYVHRRAIAPERLHAERRLANTNRRRYQDRVCALQLRAERREYCPSCEGDACPHFAPPSLIQIRVVAAAPQAATEASVPPVAVAVGDHRRASNPLVSCIMPTSDRRAFVPRAIAQFLEQDYPHRELIVVDDGADSVADLIPDDPRIRLIRLDRTATIGTKRNLACEAARGDLIAHWDDDDWMAPWRLRYQIDEMLRDGAEVCGLSRLLFYQETTRRAWEYVYPAGRPWLAGGTLCYRRSVWASHRFADVNEGEDTRFVWTLRGVKLLALRDARFYVATVHARNTSPKRTSDGRYQPREAASIEALMRGGVPDEPPLVSCIMPTSDRRPFVERAFAYFRAQDYARRELVVVDDGRDAVADLAAGDPRIRYVSIGRGRTLGAKRNAAVEAARGTYIVHWDDDDWYGPARISRQMAPLVEGAADVSALAMRTVLVLRSMQFWRCEPALHARLHYRDLCCGTIAYARALWERGGGYPSLGVGEDVRFLQRIGATGARVQRLADETLFICVRHPVNTWRIARDWSTAMPGWTPIPAPDFMPAEDCERYVELADGAESAYEWVSKHPGLSGS